MFWYAILGHNGQLLAITQAEDPNQAKRSIFRERNMTGDDITWYRALTLSEQVDWVPERYF